jgi:OOP family OmpA-OmpF porin
MRCLSAVLAILSLAAPVAAQDIAGSKDHPMFTRFPNYVITAYDDQEFGAYEFQLPNEKTQKVEGHYWRISYEAPEEKKGGAIQIARNYGNLLVSKGGAKILEDVNAEAGRLVARMPRGAGKFLWLEVQVTASGLNYDLTVVDEGGMRQDVEFTAADLSRILNEKGSVALHGVLFDTGKATIKPESAAALAPVGDLLKTNAALKLEIQGHTDNVGVAATNLKLSQDRAAAVKDYLVKTFGVAADRLTTGGFGDSKPVAPNTDEAGRAQNRRVELVKK